LIAFSFFNEAEDGDRVVSSGLEALPDEGSAGVRTFPGQPRKLRQAFVEQTLPVIGRRFSARTDRFGIFLFWFWF
jgi:hypothetical protein